MQLQGPPLDSHEGTPIGPGQALGMLQQSTISWAHWDTVVVWARVIQEYIMNALEFYWPTAHGWTGRPAHEEGGAERSTRRRSLGEIPRYLQEIQAGGSQRQTPNSNPPEGSAGPGDSPRRSGRELPS
jgi:hypothetical protein